jgi:hypothetical protein
MIETNRADRPNEAQSTRLDRTDRPHAYERYVALLTAREDRWISLSELATDIVSWADDANGVGNPSDRTERVRIRLYHEHIPRLADAGVFDWYREDGEIYVVCDTTGPGEPSRDVR